jgi:hypothetical protein
VTSNQRKHKQCYLSDSRLWFFVADQELKEQNRCPASPRASRRIAPIAKLPELSRKK